ncbi:MAG: hypothetical protein WCX16_05515, partial [Candidatus Omnitrophota bacterium]
TQHFSIWAKKYHMPYISMIDDLEFDLVHQRVKLGGKWFQEGDVITMDGYRGLIFEGNLVKKEDERVSSPASLREIEKSSSTVGGIDLMKTYEILNIKTDDVGSPFPVEFQATEDIKFDGLIPVIIDIVPGVSVPALLGLEGEESLKQHAAL